MGDGNSCEVCGGTDMKLVGGFYYCVECGTQDTNVQETVVEHTVLGDGEFAIATTKKFSVKIKKGVEMSPEWYKWHAYNFMLAGLAERLVQLGAEPAFKMKVLWIWTRYMKKYMKKDEFRRTQEVLKIRDNSSSGDEAPPAEGQEERAGWHETHRFSLSRVSRLLLLAVLAAALNLQRSAVSLPRLRRLLLHRLLPLNDAHRFLPDDIDTGKVEGFNKFINVPVTQAPNLGLALGRLQGGLRLGAWRTPDVEAALAALLRDLRLPAGLAPLVRALMWLAPVPFCDRRVFRRRPPPPRYPDYEPTIAAYLLLALKLCFGLDDDYERRLSARVESLNAAEGRPRLRVGEAEGGGVGEAEGGGARRLFSWRRWAEHVLFRRHVLARAAAPLAHERNARAADYAVMEQCDEPPARAGGGGRGRGRRRGTAVRVGDEVTVDLLRRVPGGSPDAASDVILDPARLSVLLAARAPHAALAEALAPGLPPRARALLAEDFTRYSVDYACRTVALATETGENLVVGVSEAGKTIAARLGVDIVRKYDPDVVFVRNCENGNWARTRRPGPDHVVGAAADEPPTPIDADADAEAEAKPESFEEEAEDGNIFDDDFLDIEVKEEPDRFPTDFEDAQENISLNNFSTLENFLPERGASEVGGALTDSDGDSERLRYDAARFDRAETVKRIMSAAYRELRVAPPVRFRTELAPARKRRAGREPGEAAPPERPAHLRWERKRARREKMARVDELVAAYRGSLHRDALHQVSRHVRAFLDERAEPEPEPGPDELEISSGGMRDGDVVENEDKSDESDGPAEDPVYRGDGKFDDEAYDASQLYIKFTAPPPAAPGGADEEPAGVPDEVATGSPAAERSKKKRQAPPPAPRFPLLAESPASVRSFKVWFRHYRQGFHQPEEWSRKLEREVEEELPRSFRLALREAAHALRVSAAVLYARVMAAEAALLRALGREPGRRRRAAGPPGSEHEAEPDVREPGRKRRDTKPPRSEDKAEPDVREDPGTDESRENVPRTTPTGASRGRRSRKTALSQRSDRVRSAC